MDEKARKKVIEELTTRFTYHKPNNVQAEKYEIIRATALNFAKDLVEKVPESRELEKAITCLEAAVMWANAGIARRP
jgi:hypothetical protein